MSMSKPLMKLGQNRSVDEALRALKKPDLPTKKLQVMIPEELHTRFKIECLKARVEMTEIIIKLVQQWLNDNKRME